MYLNILMEDDGEIKRYYRIEQAKIPLTKSGVDAIYSIVKLLLIFRVSTI